ncbi:hypothetical protein AOLI_G00084570 [Acnodon oligacanthus]
MNELMLLALVTLGLGDVFSHAGRQRSADTEKASRREVLHESRAGRIRAGAAASARQQVDSESGEPERQTGSKGFAGWTSVQGAPTCVDLMSGMNGTFMELLAESVESGVWEERRAAPSVQHA